MATDFDALEKAYQTTNFDDLEKNFQAAQPGSVQTEVAAPEPSAMENVKSNAAWLTSPLTYAGGKVVDALSYPGQKVEELTGAGDKLGKLLAGGARQSGTPGISKYGDVRFRGPWEAPGPAAAPVTPEQQANNERRLYDLGNTVGKTATDPLSYLGTLFKTLSLPFRGLTNIATKGVNEGAKSVARTPQFGVGQPAPAPTSLSPRPSAVPQPLPTASELAQGRAAKVNELKPAAEAGLARRDQTAPRFGHDPLPQPTGGDVTQLIEEPTGQLLKQVGVPLMGVAASVAPFLGGPSEAEAGPADQVVKGAEALAQGARGARVAEEVAAGAKIAARGLKGVPELEASTVGKVAKAAQDYYTANPQHWAGPLLPGEQLTDRLVTTVLTRSGDPAVQQVLQNSGLASSDFAHLLRQGATDAGKYLRSLQEFEMALKLKKAKGALSEVEEGLLGELTKVTADAYTPTFGSTWMQFENVRRTLMTSHFGTAFANLYGNSARVGLDVIENAVNFGVSKALGVQPVLPPTQGLDVVMRLLQTPETAKAVEQLMTSFPGQLHKLHNMHIEAELANAQGVGGALSRGLAKAQAGADVINSLNRFQEYGFRNAVFAARLDARLKLQGLSFDDVVKNNMVSAVKTEDVQFAVKEALDMTFAKQYASDTAAGSFINFVNKSGLTTLMPFPRFFINAMDYTISRSPMGILKFATEAERAKIAAGDTRLISQMITGTAMLYTAYQLMDAGAVIEQGRRLLLPDGKTIDLQRYNPYAAYFVIADLAKRKKEGRLHNVDIQKLAKSLGPDWRAGTGMAALDGALDTILGTASGEKGKGVQGFKSVTGEYAGSFLTPLGNIVDALDQFKAWSGAQPVEKDTRGGFSGPVLRNVPFANESLPTRSLPTQDPLFRTAPGARLFSFSMGPKLSPFERFMADNKGASLNNLWAGTGVPEYDRALSQAANMQGLKTKLDIVVESPRFKAKTPAQQNVEITKLLRDARTRAERLAKKLDPQAAEKAQVMRLSADEYQAIVDKYGHVGPVTIKRFREGMRK